MVLNFIISIIKLVENVIVVNRFLSSGYLSVSKLYRAWSLNHFSRDLDRGAPKSTSGKICLFFTSVIFRVIGIARMANDIDRKNIQKQFKSTFWNVTGQSV